jgi:hypothetical protein
VASASLSVVGVAWGLVSRAGGGGTVAVVSSIITAEDTSVGNSGQSDESVRVLHFECVEGMYYFGVSEKSIRVLLI